MNVTVIFDSDGRLYSSIMAHAADREHLEPGPGKLTAFPTFQLEEGQTLREIVVPDELSSLRGQKFHDRLKEYL